MANNDVMIYELIEQLSRGSWAIQRQSWPIPFSKSFLLSASKRTTNVLLLANQTINFDKID